MSTADLVYTLDDIEIIDPIYKGVQNKKQKLIKELPEKEEIQLDPYVTDQGETVYISLTERYDRIKEHKQQLDDMVQEISKNNPLDLEFVNESNVLNFEFVNTNNVTIDYDDEFYYKNYNNDQVIIDYDSRVKDIKEKKSKKGFAYTLRRVACTIGIALGISAAIKGATNYHVDTNNNITVESHKETDSKVDSLTNGRIKDSGIKKVQEKDVRNSKGLKLGDSFKLKNTNLYYTSMGAKPSVNTDDLEHMRYKAKYIAITSSDGKEVLNVIKVNEKNSEIGFKELKENCVDTYGKGIGIKVAVYNVKDKNKTALGWTTYKKAVKNNDIKSYQKTI